MSFGVARKEKRERNQELSEEDSESEPLPPAAAALQIPRNFLREVARPDDEELRKRDIGPEDDEGEEQVPEAVERFRRNLVFRVTCRKSCECGSESKSSKKLSDHKNLHENGRI